MSDYMKGWITAEEREFIKEEVRKRRTPGTLVEGKWSVGPLNRDPEVLGRFGPRQYPPEVLIRDITLRTIEQTAGVAVSQAERRCLAAALIEAGVRSVIPASLMFPGSEGAEGEVQFIKKLNGNVETIMIANSREQVDRAADGGVDMVQVVSSTIPAFNLIYAAYGSQISRAAWRGEDWRKTIKPPVTDDDQIARIQEVCRYARERGLRVSATMSMLHYWTPQFHEKFCRGMVEAGVNEIILMDGASGLGPEAHAYIVSRTKELAPGVAIAAHPHNGFGLAMANALAEIHAGAEIVEVSVNSLCSGAGQVDFAEMVATLEILYGVKTGIKMEMLTPLRRLVEDITRVPMAQNKAITGTRAWVYTEEAITEEVKYGIFVHKCLNPAIFGNIDAYELGRHSGVVSLAGKLEEMGLVVDRQQIPDILQEVHQEMEIRKRSLEDDEIKGIVERVKARKR